MAKNIYLIGGSKGGVGKSFITMAVIDLLINIDEEILLIEADTSNPDVWKSHKDSTTSEIVNLNDADGWIHLVNLCDLNPDKTVVINSAGGHSKDAFQYYETLTNSLHELKRNLITLWVINRQRDSLERLKEYMDLVPNSDIHIIRNGFFGEEKKFELYNTSKLRVSIEEKGGQSLTFPDLADRVADDLYIKRMSVETASKELPIGNRAELLRWRKEAKKVLEVVIHE